MTEHEKARLDAAIARGKLREARDAPKEGILLDAAFRDLGRGVVRIARPVHHAGVVGPLAKHSMTWRSLP